MTIRNFCLGALLAASGLGFSTYAPEAKADITYSDSCRELGGGWSRCETRRCNSETNTCIVVASWYQFIPIALIEQ